MARVDKAETIVESLQQRTNKLDERFQQYMKTMEAQIGDTINQLRDSMRDLDVKARQLEETFFKTQTQLSEAQNDVASLQNLTQKHKETLHSHEIKVKLL